LKENERREGEGGGQELLEGSKGEGGSERSSCHLVRCRGEAEGVQYFVQKALGARRRKEGKQNQRSSGTREK